jgi:FKBP12-rapamycin complex-associated protein
MYVECLDTHEDALVQMPVLDTSGSGNGASDGAFFRAVLCVWKGKQSSELKDQEELYTQAKDYIERGRKCLATELAALFFPCVMICRCWKVMIGHTATWCACSSSPS